MSTCVRMRLPKLPAELSMPESTIAIVAAGCFAKGEPQNHLTATELSQCWGLS